jgi:hypothetical protein
MIPAAAGGARAMQYASVERLGTTQSRLANGALLVRDVPVARAGVQAYHVSEIAGAVGDDTAIDAAGMVEVVRDPRDVFDPTSMASFEGASVVMRHPDAAVGPDNWSEHAIGHMQNVHRDGDLLVADLVIHDARGIDAIRNGGWRAVSCGYDANYVPLPDGRLRQVDITGNHVALLMPGERARCGERCAVGDSGWNFRGRPPMHVQDQQGSFREGGEEVRADVRRAREPDNVGRGGGGDYRSGPTLVLRLPGPITSYLLAADGDGRACVYQYSDVDGRLDPGRALTGDAARFRQVARERAEREQLAGREMAERVNRFWQARAGHG